MYRVGIWTRGHENLLLKNFTQTFRNPRIQIFRSFCKSNGNNKVRQQDIKDLNLDSKLTFPIFQVLTFLYPISLPCWSVSSPSVVGSPHRRRPETGRRPHLLLHVLARVLGKGPPSSQVTRINWPLDEYSSQTEMERCGVTCSVTGKGRSLKESGFLPCCYT